MLTTLLSLPAHLDAEVPTLDALARAEAVEAFERLVLQGARTFGLSGRLGSLLLRQGGRRTGTIPRVVLSAPVTPSAGLDPVEWAAMPEDTEPVCVVTAADNQAAALTVIAEASGRDPRLLTGRTVWAAPLASWLRVQRLRCTPVDYLTRPATSRLPTLSEYLTALEVYRTAGL